ncbi:hypothetical protein C8J57DRAFT_1247392 [Mycena rebaudengoi]|nr:hypothetical protein C8J57DRAFT_1247392 [Mycena rebaudengoi]
MHYADRTRAAREHMWSKQAVVNDARWASGGQAVAQAHAGSMQRTQTVSRQRAGGCAFGAGSQWCGVRNKQASASPPITKAEMQPGQGADDPGSKRYPLQQQAHGTGGRLSECRAKLRVGCDLNESHLIVLRFSDALLGWKFQGKGGPGKPEKQKAAGRTTRPILNERSSKGIDSSQAGAEAKGVEEEGEVMGWRRDGPDRPTARDAVIAELCSTIKIENIAANIGYWLSAQIGMHALPCSSKQRGESVGLPQGEGK